MESDQQELLLAITSFLNSHHISYMVTGAWSVIYYGRPRASHDIDFVVDIKPKDIKRVVTELKELSESYSFQESAVESAVKKGFMFNILHLPTYLKLDFWLLTDDPFDTVRFKRKRVVNILENKMVLASPEDTILQKLRWNKISPTEKSFVDAAFVYQIQKKNLNFNYINKWAKYLKVTRELNKLDKVNLEQYI